MSPTPVDITPHMETGNFELINCLKAFNKVPVFEYKSRRTGLTVIVAEVEGPIVNGYFCLATEAFDDDGLPHTLEHLIFLGSEDYPYKGVLDLLANRCLASGTNAWTDTDHTCYTMETAGSDGFLALMPIFLDHILYPKLTDEGFITEVHHITPNGDDAGVVYCEMQGRENSAESRLHLNLNRAMYPGHCGYSSETGGIMKNLRESTTNQKVRDYHRQFYRPENLKIIITGQIQHNEIFKALQKIEMKIQLKSDRGVFIRPWQTPVPPLQESRDLIIKYPADEEINGLYCIGWRGANAVYEQYKLTAINLLLKYFTEFSTYTLPQEFVEIEDPYASHISYSTTENLETCIYLIFHNVPIKKLPEIKEKLQKIFENIVNNNDINMERLINVIERNKLEYLNNLENSPNSTLAFMIIGQILYGNTKTDFEQRLNPLIDLDKLLKEPKSFWIDLIKQYLINNKYISIQCIPSKSEHEQMAKDEAERIEKQIQQLGDDGLKRCEQILNDALEYNNRQPPVDILTSIPIPSFDSINFFNLKRYRSDSIEENQQRIDLSQTAVYTCFDDANSEFVYVYALLDSSEIPEDLRVYLPLMLELLFESPIRKNDEIIPYEIIVEQLKKDVLSSEACFGVGLSSRSFRCYPYSTTITIMLQFIPENYQKGIQWLHDILFNIIFTIERIKIISTKINNTVSQIKRSGPKMLQNVMNKMRYITNSNIFNNGVLLQNQFLTDLQQKLSNDIDGNEEGLKIVENCVKIWKLLTLPKNIVLHLMGNLDRLEKPIEYLNQKFLPVNYQKYQQKLNPIPDHQLLKTTKNDIQGCFIGMACLESSFFYQTVESIKSHDDPDLPALMLYLQYLTQAEGPMWRQIRGKGYAYGYSLFLLPQNGLLNLIFARATNVVGAYSETKQIINEHIEKRRFEDNLIESAKSSLIFELIEEERTIGHLTLLSLLSYFQKTDYTYNRMLLNRISEVTVDDLIRVGEMYLLPLFDVNRIKTAILSDPSKADTVVEAFKDFGIDLERYPSLEESFLKF